MTKKKKETLEDVNIMEGLDFKANQARMREEIKRVKKQKKIEAILCGFITIAVVVMTCVLLVITTEEAMNSCVNAGHSVSYCERGL